MPRFGPLEKALAMFYLVPIQEEYSTLKDVPDYIGGAIPFFFVMIVIEMLVGVIFNRKIYSWKDTIMSLSLGAFQQIQGLWFRIFTAFAYEYIYAIAKPTREHVWSFFPKSVLNIPLETTSYWQNVAVFIVGIVGVDFGYYVFHRCAHEFHLLWISHSVHHSGERYNFATALRQGAFQPIFGFLIYMPLAAMGFPYIHYVRHYKLNTIYQFWIHTDAIGKLPWIFEMILNTASHHRMHHRTPGNCNYGGVFIIFDRLFGTFQAEWGTVTVKLPADAHNNNSDLSVVPVRNIVGGRSPVYGLAIPSHPSNPLYANFQHWHRVTENRLAADRKKKQLSMSSDHDQGYSFMQVFQTSMSVLLQKRIHSHVRLVTDLNQLFPDLYQHLQYTNSSGNIDGDKIDVPTYVESSYSEGFAGQLEWLMQYTGIANFASLPPNFDSALLACDNLSCKKENSVKNDDSKIAISSAPMLGTREIKFLHGRNEREYISNFTWWKFLRLLTHVLVSFFFWFQLMEVSVEDCIGPRMYNVIFEAVTVITMLQMIQLFYSSPPFESDDGKAMKQS